MHILFITSYYPSLEAPITGIFFHDQAVALHKAGHKVGILVTPRLNATIAHIKREGVSKLKATTCDSDFAAFPVYRMHWGWFPRPFPFIIAPLLASAGSIAFERYVREQGMPDVVHGHNIFYGGYLASVLSEKYKIPSVITEYSSSYLEGLIIFPGQPAIIRRSLRTSKSNMVCGSSLIKPLNGFAPEQKFQTLGCIIDTDFFSPAAQPSTPTPFKFLVIAQLKERRKRFDILLTAFASAFRGRHDVLLKIRGHGPLRPELDKLIEELGIGAQVEFLPTMTKEQLRDLIQQSHCLVSSSSVETFGVSVAEAIACGHPVVSTISGGPEDFVTERSGILVPPGSVPALAQAMQQIVTTYDRYQPNEVRLDVSERYSEPNYVQRLEEIYQRAMAT